VLDLGNARVGVGEQGAVVAAARGVTAHKNAHGTHCMHLMPFFHKCSVCLFSATGAGASIFTDSPRTLLPVPRNACGFFCASCSRCHSSADFPPCARIFSASFSSSITVTLVPPPLLPPPEYLQANEGGGGGARGS